MLGGGLPMATSPEEVFTSANGPPSIDEGAALMMNLANQAVVELASE